MYWPLQENVLTKDDKNELSTFILENDRYTQHTTVKRFEDAFSAWQNCDYSVYVNSGSSANLLLVSALKELRAWNSGSEVLVPALTWPTTITPLIQLGLQPVFVDIELNRLSLDVQQLLSHITDKTCAIFVVHLIGYPALITELKKFADDHNLDIIEDCCESQGATVDSIKVGNFGIGGTFSFYWGHHMTSIEGGMICTNSKDLYHLLLLKRSHGLARELPSSLHESYQQKYHDIDFKFLFLSSGFNLRNTELNAVVGLRQLKNIDKYIEIRNANYLKFVKVCDKYSNYLNVKRPDGISSFVLPFFLKRSDLTNPLKVYLAKIGIETRPLISGNLLRQPFLEDYAHLTLSNTDYIHDCAFYIGNNQFVNSERIHYLDSKLEAFFDEIS